MVPTLSVEFMTMNIVKLFTLTLACTYFIIHSIRQTILSPVYDFKKICLVFYLEKLNIVMLSIKTSGNFMSFTSSTLSNSDVVHAVPGYF